MQGKTRAVERVYDSVECSTLTANDNSVVSAKEKLLSVEG